MPVAVGLRVEVVWSLVWGGLSVEVVRSLKSRASLEKAQHLWSLESTASLH